MPRIPDHTHHCKILWYHIYTIGHYMNIFSSMTYLHQTFKFSLDILNLSTGIWNNQDPNNVDIMLLSISHNVSDLILTTYRNWTLYYLGGVWLGVDLRMDTTKNMCFARDWTTCSWFVHYSRFNTQPSWMHLYDRLMKGINYFLW